MSQFIPIEAIAAPPLRPRWWMDPYGVLVRASLLVAWLPGFTLGLVLMLELAVLRRAGIGWLPHAQTHAQAQIYGFVGLFFFGVATQMLPRFMGQPLRARGALSTGGILLCASVIGRLSIQPFGPGMLRDGLMLLTAIVGLLGALLTVLPFALTAMSSPRRWEAWQRLVLVGFGCWILGSIASFVGTLGLAAGQMLIAQALNELVIVAGLWGFAACVTLAVGFRIFPNFLLLQPMRTRSMAGATVLYGLGLALVGAGWSGQAVSDDQLSTWQMLRAMGWLFLTFGGAGLIWSLRIFEAPLRESVAPHITYPTKLWFRIAYTYFLLSLGMGSWFAVREWLNGVIPDGTALSAQRHAIAMGYLMPIIVGMAGRILPEFSAEMARRQKVLTALVWSWIVGAGLRIGGELWTGYNTPGMIVMVAGATLAFLGFAWFSVRLWVSIGRRKPETIGV